jgi:hypothetical protein
MLCLATHCSRGKHIDPRQRCMPIISRSWEDSTFEPRVLSPSPYTGTPLINAVPDWRMDQSRVQPCLPGNMVEVQFDCICSL